MNDALQTARNFFFFLQLQPAKAACAHAFFGLFIRQRHALNKPVSSHGSTHCLHTHTAHTTTCSLHKGLRWKFRISDKKGAPQNYTSQASNIDLQIRNTVKSAILSLLSRPVSQTHFLRRKGRIGHFGEFSLLFPPLKPPSVPE